MKNGRLLIALLALALCACQSSDENVLLGTLERERVSVAAEAAEAIIRIDVSEGDTVSAGQSLLALDARRSDARLAQAEAELRRAEAQLNELRSGTRAETIDAARAELKGAEASVANARRERDRIQEMRQRGLMAVADLDRANTELRAATATRDALRARLAEWTNGTRIEDIEQAEASLQVARAQVEQRRLERARYDVVAPRDGRIDALPFKLGDQPPAGATVVSMLAGSSFARVHVPASQRPAIRIGMRCELTVTGMPKPFTAQVRSISSDPAFTPYFALTGDDASRLSYRAELVLDAGDTGSLAAGLPVQARCGDAAAAR